MAPQPTDVQLRRTLALSTIAYFMVVLDSVVVITALPRMQRDLHTSLATAQWTLNAFGIAFAAAIITAAALGDRLGRRRVFVAGLALFTITSAVCALARSISLLIAARGVQGLGGAIVLPLSLTILTEAYPAERRGTVVGIYGGLAGLAVAIGPLVGGAITQGLDWHWIFWINVPIGALACVLAPRLMPESYGPRVRLDLPGVMLISASAVAVVWGLVRASDAGWASAEVLTTISAGLALLAVFIAWEHRAPAPMVPLGLFRARAFSAGNATGFLMTAAIFAAGFLVTQYFQFALHYSPFSAGLRLLPFFMTPMLISPAAGAISDHIGRRPVIATGLLLLAVGLGWAALDISTTPSFGPLLLALFVAGAGVSMALPTVPTQVLSAVEPRDMGTASGVANTMQRFGAVFGIAVTSTIFTAYGHLGSPSAVTDGIKPALLACAALALLGTLTALAAPHTNRNVAAASGLSAC
jgi:EmrB/QacA subfamily drug resistance transporter